MRTRADPTVPVGTLLWLDPQTVSHQADVKLVPGCVTYPKLVQQGYMAVQHGYMAVQQGYMLDSLWWVGGVG